MRIICLGDSIMQYNDCTTYPQTGWVQELARFFPVETEFLNFAKNGRSTKSFIDEGRFDEAKNVARAGDWALIQFGHNDEKKQDPARYTSPDEGGDYRKNLALFVRELQAKGVKPIILSPMARRKFVADHKMEDTHGAYPAAALAEAKNLNIPSIDMTSLTFAFVEKTGELVSRRFFMNFDAGEYDNFPDGKSDNSHLRPDGAFAFAKLAAQELAKLGKQWPDYAALSNAVITGGMDASEFEKDTADEKLMA
ncbi:MAG: hypothetical protein IJS09_11100 [Treponema sp.]|nr:hypothetical protein [Treponema sp.]